MNVSWVTDLITNLPSIIESIAPGFLLIASFSWAAAKYIKNGTTLIIASIVLTYLIKGLISLAQIALSSSGTIGLCVCSAILGVVLAIIYKSEGVNHLIGKLGIKRTTNDTIWDDVVGEKAWIAFWDPEDNRYYCGQFRFQNYENETSCLVITAYYTADTEGNIIISYTEDLERKLMFNPNNYEKIIISKNDPFGHYAI